MLLNKRCVDKTDMNYKQYENYDKQMNYDQNMNYKDMHGQMGMPMNMDMGCCDNQYPGVVCPPVYECPQVRCCHREILHEVPQE